VNEESLDERDRLARLFGLIAVRAGEAILQVRPCAGTNAITKSDGSPVTAADLEADRIIRECLQRDLPGLPVITEETFAAATAVDADKFILVDPLDGTREFIQGRDEFTVNIALIERHAPVAGAVYAPALRQLYLGGTIACRMTVAGHDASPNFGALCPIRAGRLPAQAWRAVVSRSHLDPETRAWIDRHPVGELRPSGSSLKFCVIAAGEADVYPRLAPTMEWDTASGHAILLAAGGSVIGLDGEPLRYGKPGYRNGNFVAWASIDGDAGR
jgi:3'(2'), 5'-bisphosphate nucleotidase